MPHSALKQPQAIARAIILAGIALALAACESLGPLANLPPSLDRAESLANRGDHAGSARVFENLANQNAGDDATRLRLRAVREWLAANQPDEAGRVYETIAPGANALLRTQHDLLGVSLRLARGDNTGGWTAVQAIQVPGESPEREQYFALRQRSALAVGRANDAIQTQTQLEAALPSDSARANSRRDLLDALAAATDRGVKLEPQSAGRDANLRGWLELGLIAAQARRGARVAPALASWRSRFPQHAASALSLQDLGGPAVAGNQPASSSVGAHVAVLLPLTGRAAAQASQIRDGLLASWFSNTAGTATPLRFYDTATTAVPEALRLANDSGAEMIIGPLLRDDVQAALDYSGGRPPLLALNFLTADKTSPNDFYQYALSPEDEARSVARRALADGRRRALALVPAGDWGQRVLTAFTEEMMAGGGTILASTSFNAGAQDHSSAITALLRINDSRARARRIEAIIGGSVNAQPRRRGDVDFIFVPSTAAVARQMRPQLKFYYAGDIPAYATSDAYEGPGAANQDADGLMFPDMPWVLTGGPAVSRARTALRAAYGENAGPRGKLFAFGYDAWTVAAALRGSAGAGLPTISGLTGELSLDANRRVRRELDWAQIRGSGARVLGGGASSSTPGGGR
jgi:outer membrane PBP1 activator LpoA protein